MKSKSANGVTGHLIYTQSEKHMFRVYDSEHNFIDYALHDVHFGIDDPV